MPNSSSGTGSAIDSGDATTFAELFGATQPAEGSVQLGVSWTDGENVYIGTLTNDTAASTENSIYVEVGTSPSEAIACSTTTTGKTLEVVFETLTSDTDILVIADGSITKTGSNAVFTIPSSITGVERTLRVSVRDASTQAVYGTGFVFITYEAIGD